MTETPIQDRFNRVMDRLNIPQKTVVAVSGGADSMALMLLTAAWARQTGRPAPLVVTIDHRLRAAAAGEARQVGAWAASHGLNHTVLAWHGEKPQANIQSTARTARYRLLDGFCRDRGVDALLTAHTEDDQAETVLLRLARGSGVDGLAGIAETAPLPLGPEGDPRIRLIRPLLSFAASDLRRYLKQRDQDWIEDPSNSDLRYGRVRMRKALAELAPVGLTAPGLAKTARRMQQARAALANPAAELLQISTRIFTEGYADLEAAPFAAAPRETALRALAGLLIAVGGGTYRPRLNRLERLLDAVTMSPAGRDPDVRQNGYTLAGCRILPLDRERARWRLTREPGRRAHARTSFPPAASGRAPCEVIWDRRFRLTLSGPEQALGALPPLEAGFLGPGLPPALRTALEASPDWARRWREIPAPVRPTLPALWAGEILFALPSITAVPLTGEPEIAPPIDKIRVEATFLGLNLRESSLRKANSRL